MPTSPMVPAPFSVEPAAPSRTSRAWPDRPVPWSDLPGSPFGPLAVGAGQDVLCLVCTSGGQVHDAPPLLEMLYHLVGLQQARLWVQFYDTDLHDEVQPVTAELLTTTFPGNGGRDVQHALDRAVAERLPLPNGAVPAQVILACDGQDRSVQPPVVNGVPLPTVLVIPSTASLSHWANVRSTWALHSDVPVVRFPPHWANELMVEQEKRTLRETLDSDERWTATAPLAVAPPRARRL